MGLSDDLQLRNLIADWLTIRTGQQRLSIPEKACAADYTH